MLNIALLYRRIESIGALTVALWVGTLADDARPSSSPARCHFDPRVAFDFPPGAFKFSIGLLVGLGAASRIGIYDYLGYYDICYLGDEVRDPGRVIPRSILISIVRGGRDLHRDQPVGDRRRPVARVRAGADHPRSTSSSRS